VSANQVPSNMFTVFGTEVAITGL